MVENGILDQIEITRYGLWNAPIEDLMITTGSMVAEAPDKEAARGDDDGGGMGRKDF